MITARCCPFLHHRAPDLLFPHLLTSNTFLCLIPSYTLVQPLTFSSFFCLTSHLLKLPPPLKLSNDKQRIISNFKKLSDSFLCISHYDKTRYELSQYNTGAYRCAEKQATYNLLPESDLTVNTFG